ncbi:double zinc ribbon [Lentilactobacillus sunkii]|jgi:predicted amidophosphoribosyltransferase|uniref:Double zinc ribbon n=1 Tax=Lentilactobacillus sunkii TaxID=481719 RepID=A0A1E7XBN8_9LACO|nr:zinc ribbon domain-containing protein [Lentilactobacillus sunkii]OFA10545.1 double zinc ribbon [Lentilactobacillus sunkii]
MAEQKFSFCPYCGAKLKPDDVVCPNCGKKLPIDDEQSQSTNSWWSGLSKLFGNPYKEGMSRYQAGKKAKGNKVKK